MDFDQSHVAYIWYPKLFFIIYNAQCKCVCTHLNTATLSANLKPSSIMHGTLWKRLIFVLNSSVKCSPKRWNMLNIVHIKSSKMQFVQKIFAYR